MGRLPPELTDLITKIYTSNNIVLFIGNGASADAGGPKTEDLVEAIKKRFPSAEYQSEDFLQTCTDVMDTTLTNRADLEEVITKRLYGLKPSAFHRELPLHIWPAIFTTNYDYLIEQSYYDAGNSGVQLPDPIFSDQDLLALHDKEKVKVFKLMGCIVSQHPRNRLVITRSDYNASMRARPLQFRALRDIMKDGAVLYVGYSFRDYLLWDILSDLQRELGDHLPYSYALMPTIDTQSVRFAKLREKRVIPINLTATEFANILQTGVQPKLVPVGDRKGINLLIKGQRKVISHKDYRLYSECCNLLSEDAITSTQPDNVDTRKDFFRGLLRDWTGYVHEWDFKREQYKSLLKRVSDELKSPNVGNNRSLLVCGPAGSGKTVALNRVAFDVYKKSGNPVVFLRPYYEDVDLKLLASLCEELSSLDVVGRSKRGGSRVRVMIVMDMASSHVADFRLIPTVMKSRGIPVLVLGSARENEWDIACQKLFEQLPDGDILHIGDQFESPDERLRFGDHLNRLGLVEGALSATEIANIIEADYDNSFFASVYSLIEPARPTLEAKINDEYTNLSDFARQAYLLVASFYQYGLPMPLELLVRSLSCSYQQFMEEIFHSDVKRIICDVDAPLEGVYLGARHRIVAEKLIERQVPSADLLAKTLSSILAKLNPRNVSEVQISRSLLIKFIGPNGSDRRLSAAQKRVVFDAALQRGGLEDSAVLHHFGLLESDGGDDERALELSQRALRLVEQRQQLFFLRSERVENIHNTLGVIYGRMAAKAEGKNDIEGAENLYSCATEHFSLARGGEFQTPHPYDSESRMYFLRGKRTPENISKVTLFMKALDILDQAEDNLPDESLPSLLQLRAAILDEIHLIQDLNGLLTQMEADEELNLQASSARARLALLNPTESLEIRQRAMGIVQKTIAAGKYDVAILRAYCRLHKILCPSEVKELYKILSMRFEIPEEKRNLSLLYELGILAFFFEEYPKSLDCFRRLERISQGHPKRWGIYDVAKDKDGKTIEFRGTVTKIDSLAMGYVQIPSLNRTLPFLPYAQKTIPQAGQNITCEIGFNFRGWLAINLVK
jgi:tetratricopeptide (TPR) repeat protein